MDDIGCAIPPRRARPVPSAVASSDFGDERDPDRRGGPPAMNEDDGRSAGGAYPSSEVCVAPPNDNLHSLRLLRTPGVFDTSRGGESSENLTSTVVLGTG